MKNESGGTAQSYSMFPESFCYVDTALAVINPGSPTITGQSCAHAMIDMFITPPQPDLAAGARGPASHPSQAATSRQCRHANADGFPRQGRERGKLAGKNADSDVSFENVDETVLARSTGGARVRWCVVFRVFST